MDRRYKVGIIFCGGCNCYFDREDLYRKITGDLADTCDFFYYSPDAGISCDLIVVINGCQSECLLTADYTSRLLLINNKNEQQACQLIREALMGEGR